MAHDDSFMGGQGRLLEESFFARHNSEALKKLREEAARQAKRQALAEHSGITSDAVLDKLVELDVNVERVTAFTLVPLIEVAWADGAISPAERAAIVKAAADRGVAPDSAAGQLLANWLENRPDPQLMSIWVEYTGAFVRVLGEQDREQLKRDVLGRARAVAEAAGGFLGIGSVSAEERRVLDELEKAFIES